jgi:hypothetical protein
MRRPADVSAGWRIEIKEFVEDRLPLFKTAAIGL